MNPGSLLVNDARRWIRWVLTERAMWTVAVVVSHVLGEDCRQMAFADDEHPVGALPAYGAHPAFRECVRSGRLWRSLDHVDAGGGEHRVEDGRKFGVPIAQQEPQARRALVQVHST